VYTPKKVGKRPQKPKKSTPAGSQTKKKDPSPIASARPSETTPSSSIVHLDSQPHPLITECTHPSKEAPSVISVVPVVVLEAEEEKKREEPSPPSSQPPLPLLNKNDIVGKKRRIILQCLNALGYTLAPGSHRGPHDTYERGSHRISVPRHAQGDGRLSLNVARKIYNELCAALNSAITQQDTPTPLETKERGKR
jgi:hypothetical protein